MSSATFATQIETTGELLAADFEAVELAYIRLQNGPEYRAGRIVGQWTDDISLRFKGHKERVSNVANWELVEFEPIRSPMHKQMVANGLEGYDQ